MAGCRLGWSKAALVLWLRDAGIRRGNSKAVKQKTIFCADKGVAPLCLTQLDQWDWTGRKWSNTKIQKIQKKYEICTEKIWFRKILYKGVAPLSLTQQDQWDRNGRKWSNGKRWKVAKNQSKAITPTGCASNQVDEWDREKLIYNVC